MRTVLVTVATVVFVLSGCAGSSTDKSPSVPPLSTVSSNSNGPKGYLAEVLPDGTSGVSFIQWTEASGLINGQLQVASTSLDGSETPEYENVAFTGTRSDSTVTLTFSSSGSAITGTLDGDTLTLLIPDPQTGTFASFVHHSATIQDYNNAVAAFQQRIVDANTAKSAGLVGIWQRTDRVSPSWCAGCEFIEFKGDGSVILTWEVGDAETGVYAVAGDRVTFTMSGTRMFRDTNQKTLKYAQTGDQLFIEYWEDDPETYERTVDGPEAQQTARNAPFVGTWKAAAAEVGIQIGPSDWSEEALTIELRADGTASFLGTTLSPMTYAASADGSALFFYADGWSDNYSVSLSGDRLTIKGYVYFREVAQTPAVGRIAFAGDRDFDFNPTIYVVNSDGTDQRQLTDDPGVHVQPTWSPDGRRIAYLSLDESDNTILYTIDADGSNQSSIVSTLCGISHPSWSPTGDKIAFAGSSKCDDIPGYDIYVVNVDGSNLRNITEQPGEYRSLAWSPDGQRIAFWRLLVDGGGKHIGVIDADGSNVERLTDDAIFPHGDVVWSPDGQRIAFDASEGDDTDNNIYVMRSDGSDLRRLSDLPDDEREPQWSPDGRWVAFFSYEGDGIFLANADGSDQSTLKFPVLSDDDEEPRCPVWSPDGKEIAFWRASSLWVARADGSNPRQITSDLQIVPCPVWAPAGASSGTGP